MKYYAGMDASIVPQEAALALDASEYFIDASLGGSEFRRKTGAARDTPHDDRAAWVVRDETYVSARWPGDALSFARSFCETLEASAKKASMGVH